MICIDYLEMEQYVLNPIFTELVAGSADVCLTSTVPVPLNSTATESTPQGNEPVANETEPMDETESCIEYASESDNVTEFTAHMRACSGGRVEAPQHALQSHTLLVSCGLANFE